MKETKCSCRRLPTPSTSSYSKDCSWMAHSRILSDKKYLRLLELSRRTNSKKWYNVKRRQSNSIPALRSKGVAVAQALKPPYQNLNLNPSFKEVNLSTDSKSASKLPTVSQYSRNHYSIGVSQRLCNRKLTDVETLSFVT